MREEVKDRSRLVHILEAIERLQKYAGGLRKEELETDVLRYYGIVILKMENFIGLRMLGETNQEYMVHMNLYKN